MAMIVGVLLLELHLPASHSLKAKRQVVKSVLARLQHRYQVAAAEVEQNDRWQVASLGVACVSNDAGHARSILEACVAFVESERLDIEVTDHVIDVFPAP